MPRRSAPSSEAAGAVSYGIADLAREFDVTPRAIRFYEDQGLLSPRRDGQRRIYSPDLAKLFKYLEIRVVPYGG